MELYNKDKKEEFLSQFENEKTKEVYRRVFKKSLKMEETTGVDLYDFKEDNYDSLIAEELKPLTRESARTYGNILSSYVQWAIDKNVSRHGSNPVRRRQEYFYQFVKEKKMYFSLEEKNAILFSLINSQDQFLVQALFEGIEGRGMSELSNLKVTDIKINENSDLTDYKDYLVKLKNDKEESRILGISKQTYSLALSANREVEYYKKNGEMDYHKNIKDVIEMSESSYIMKRNKTNTGGGEKITKHTLRNRLEMIKSLEEFEDIDGINMLTAKNLVRSGMIFWAKRLYDRDGKIEREQIEEVCERYNVRYKWSLRDFLNEGVVEELYPMQNVGS